MEKRSGRVVRDESPVGSKRQNRSASTGEDIRHGKSRDSKGEIVEREFEYFAGIDWGSVRHRVCLMDKKGDVIEVRWIEHSGQSLATMVEWLRQQSQQTPSQLAAAIEVPRGSVVETLLEQGFAVFSINPKQLDRFRDRYSPSGAKDDSRDAFVLADSLRTNQKCFRGLSLDEPAMIRLRELSRLEDEIVEELSRSCNRLRDQLHRFFPQLLELSEAANEPWIWTLLEQAPGPARAAKLTEAKIARLLKEHRIRRIGAEQVRSILRSKPLRLAPWSRRGSL
jgi:transposase